MSFDVSAWLLLCNSLLDVLHIYGTGYKLADFRKILLKFQYDRRRETKTLKIGLK